jgi:hypothetical protein
LLAFSLPLFAFHQSSRQRFASASNIQLFVPLLFHHSLIKLYFEGNLTGSGYHGEMGAQKITTLPKL